MKISFSSKWDSGKVVANVQNATDAGVKEGLEHLLQVSLRLVPEDSGDLRSSGKVVIEGRGKGSVQYGTTPETAQYALVQHERMDFKHPRGGQAKYLENAMTREAKRIFQIMAQAARRGFR